MYQEVRGYTQIITDRNALLSLGYNDYDSVCASWVSKQEFYDGEDDYGNPIRIKISPIVAIVQVSKENRQIMNDEIDERVKTDNLIL